VSASQPAAREKPGHTALVTGGGLLLQQVLAFVGGVWVAHLLGPVPMGRCRCCVRCWG
jgi:O-antigen/teichoic acid export membrane protein